MRGGNERASTVCAGCERAEAKCGSRYRNKWAKIEEREL